MNYYAVHYTSFIAQKTQLQRLFTDTCSSLHVKESEVKSKSKKQHLVDARFIFCEKAHSLGKSYSEIGLFLNRTHATIINAVKKANYYNLTIQI